jgi:AraC-like DNA-binding protein
MSPTISVQLLPTLLAGMTILGVDVDAIRKRCASLLADANGGASDRRVPASALRDFWAVAIDVSGDPALGVRVGALARTESYGAVGEVLRSCATLGDALLKASRYLKLWNESVSFSVLIEEDRAFLWQRSTAPEVRHPASADALLALIVALSRQLTGRHLIADEAHFAHPAPKDVSAYERMFGGKLCFDQQEYGLAIPPDILTLTIGSHDATKRDALALQADALLQGVAEEPSYAARAAEILQRELNGGNPTLKHVASELGLHPKSLTRRLKSEGTSHRELLDSRRKELAGRYVGATELGLTEIAFLLGFSDASAFHKSFRRWYGVGPSAFRARAGRTSPS